ncbi:MAG: phosphoribosylanthranilate isomerase [Halodesulfurarchaeum sp.]
MVVSLSSPPRVKICGHTHEADIEISVDAGADAVGVIAEVPVETPREVPPDQARDLIETVPPFVTGVLVTMPSSPDDVAPLVETVRPDAVQVHAGLTPDELEDLYDRVSVPLIGAVDGSATDRIDEYAAVADALLLDSLDEAGAGGTGRTHDWDAARQAADSLSTPLVLAGGLTPDNVGDAVETASPYAVDVASGVEDEPGRKNPDAVRRFVQEAKDGPPAERGESDSRAEVDFQ